MRAHIATRVDMSFLPIFYLADKKFVVSNLQDWKCFMYLAEILSDKLNSIVISKTSPYYRAIEYRGSPHSTFFGGKKIPCYAKPCYAGTTLVLFY